MSDGYDKLIAEARAELGTREAKAVDWDAVDAGLFERIEQDRLADRARLAPSHRRSLTIGLVGLAAAAALAAVIAGKGRDGIDAGAIASDESAGTIVSVDGNGQGRGPLVDGKTAVAGVELSLGDVLETREASATIERPGKLTMTLEPGSRTAVTHVHGALVLALERGAVEAQVVPVASGEAFAVDIEGTRVAVHGTHLRVERVGERVVVDLNEGVIAVGEAPRAGSVQGTLVTAPAHVEFEAADPLGTLTQSHDLADVRPPAERSQAVTALSPRPVPVHASPSSRPAQASRVVPRPEPRSVTAPEASAKPAPSTLATPATPAPELSPEDAIALAVRTCIADQIHADGVTVVVSTTLHLELADDGSVRAARFDPPVSPGVNACAVTAIYRERFTHGGTAAIAIDFTN